MSNYPDGCNGPPDEEIRAEQWDDEADEIVMRNLPNASEDLRQEYKEEFCDADPEDGEGIAEEKLPEYKLRALMEESINFGK